MEGVKQTASFIKDFAGEKKSPFILKSNKDVATK